MRRPVSEGGAQWVETVAVPETEDPLPEILIVPSRGLPTLGLHEISRYRELLYFLVWRDIKVRYKQTALGVAWATLVASELIAAQRGLGAMIQNASTYFLLDVIYVGIICIGCIALIMDLILRKISARLLVWQERAVS